MDCVIVADEAGSTGGVTSVMVGQAEALTALGHRVHMFVGEGAIAPELAARVDRSHVFCAAGAPRNRKTEIWNRPAAQALAGFLRDFDPATTIVHVHSMTMRLSPAIGVALRRSGLRWFCTAHDPGWSCPNGTYYDFKRERLCDRRPLSTGCLAADCTRRGRAQKLFFLAKAAALKLSALEAGAEAVFVPSERMAQLLRSEPGRRGRVRVLLNPVLAARPPSADPERRGFVFVGRLIEEKGGLEFVRAATRTGAPALVIGDGPARAEMEAEAGPEVRFAGWVPQREIGRHLETAAALVMPSKHLEAFGLVAAEALAAGAPAVVSRSAGASEIVEDGVNGLIVDMVNPNSLDEALTKLSQNEIVKPMSRAAVQRYWLEPLDITRYGASLVEQYQMIQPGWAIS